MDVRQDRLRQRDTQDKEANQGAIARQLEATEGIYLSAALPPFPSS